MPNDTHVPVALFIFNRPEETARVFAAIRDARPTELFVIADGPRNEQEAFTCEKTRAVVNVDWPCTVKTNYAQKNMGCRDRVASGITWVFTHVDRSIILEDDCVPDQTFFPFCEELLEKYKDEPRVMCVDGMSFQTKNPSFKSEYSYYFSLVSATWGWATWRRAWKLYDVDMKTWPALRESAALKPVFNHPGGYERFVKTWDRYYQKDPSTRSWDGQWAFACIAHGGLSINPNVNLITNIGVNERATHYRGENEWANRPTQAMKFPLVHPKEIERNRAADAFVFRNAFNVDKKLRYRLVRPIKNHFPRVYQMLKNLFRK